VNTGTGASENAGVLVNATRAVFALMAALLLGVNSLVLQRQLVIQSRH